MKKNEGWRPRQKGFHQSKKPPLLHGSDNYYYLDKVYSKLGRE